MNTHSIPTVIVIILSMTSCKRAVNSETDSGADSLEIANVSDNVIQDTLTETEFISLFNKQAERKAYNLSTDQDLKNALKEQEVFSWKKGLIVGDTIKRLNFKGNPLSFKSHANGIKRIILVRYQEVGAGITLYTLDKNYNVIADCNLSDSGADAGESWKSFGEFENDSLYHITSMGYSDSDTVNQISEAQYIIHANGKIEIVQVNHE